MSDELSWTFEIEAGSITQGGKSFELVPDEATRARLAKAANVVSIPSLKVSLDVTPTAGGGLDVTGKLEGVVRQTCVVSLEEFDNQVAESISVDYAVDPESLASNDDEEEIEHLPDPIVDGKIDLGQLATEFLILSVDPYPRKPGAAFAAPLLESAPEEPRRNPFERLSGLKDRIKKQ